MNVFGDILVKKIGKKNISGKVIQVFPNQMKS